MIKKITSILFLMFSPLVSLSCVNYQEAQTFENLIDHNLDHLNNISSNEEIQTQNILTQLLKIVYKNNETVKVEFLNKQNNTKKIEKEFENLAQNTQNLVVEIEQINKKISELNEMQARIDFLPSFFSQTQKDQVKNDLLEQNNKLNELNKQWDTYKEKVGFLISKNWYWYFQNLNKFNFVFYKYIAQELIDAVKLNDNQIENDFAHLITNEYIDKINNLSASKTFKVANNYLQNLILGEESYELNNTNVYYLTSNKTVYRLVVNNFNSDNSTLVIEPYIWYFENLRKPQISTALVASVYHYTKVHKYVSGYNQFINDLVDKQRYGEPAYVLPIIREQNE
ncbi:aromatic motif membrane protein [Mycoplasma sp. 744]|uniref:aromatic motif membrane protein n=1 Tax=Mycoplasma sp. 744 TaxID=3108531 RepID=UPI002B1DD2A2|nr:aromatic motif membrane protein [Mycoplasma sp. 744]MEA4115387.1 aromatic motif membrane protein [Mycoplasma sp. 744]